MISKAEYKVLKMLYKNPKIDETAYQKELNSLLSDMLITHNVTKETYNAYIYHGFLVTNKGDRAFEEYKSFILDRRKSTVAMVVSLVSIAVAIAGLFCSIFIKS